MLVENLLKRSCQHSCVYGSIQPESSWLIELECKWWFNIMTQARNWNTPETTLARVHLMSQSVLLSHGMFLHGGSYFSCCTIVWEAAKGWMLPPSVAAHSTSVMVVHCVLLCKAKLLSLHWTYLVMDQGMESPCTCPPDSWDRDLGCSALVLSCEFSLLLCLGKGPSFLVFVSVLFHMSSQRNKWEIECVQESEINPIWKLKRWSRWVHLFRWWFS